jgi:hypothetical protein
MKTLIFLQKNTHLLGQESEFGLLEINRPNHGLPIAVWIAVGFAIGSVAASLVACSYCACVLPGGFWGLGWRNVSRGNFRPFQ